MGQYKIVCIPAGTPVGDTGRPSEADRYRLYHRSYKFLPWTWIGLSSPSVLDAHKDAAAHQNLKTARRHAKPPRVIKKWEV